MSGALVTTPFSPSQQAASLILSSSTSSRAFRASLTNRPKPRPECYYRVNTSQKRRSKILQSGGCGTGATGPANAVGRIEAGRERKDRTERAVRHFILSAEIPPERRLELVRNHWGTENGLHRILDVVMDEDRKQNRTLNGPECLYVLRRIALNIVRLMNGDHSLKGRMHITSVTDKYLLGLLANTAGKF